MRKSSIFLTLVLALVILFGFKVEAQITQVTGAGVSLASNNARAIVKDGLGNYYVAFTISNYVYVRKSEDGGNTWKYWNGIAFGTTGSECYLNYYSNASIAVDSSNNLYLVYSKGSGGIYYMKYIPGGSWTSEANLSGNYSSGSPTIVIDSSDIIHVIWSGPSELSPSYNQIRYAKYSGGTWSSPIDLTTGNYYQYNPSIEIDSSNNLHLVWSGKSAVSPSKYQIRYAKYSGGSWSSPVDITSGSYDQYNPSIAVDSSNNLNVIWHGYSAASTSTYQIRYAKYSGGSWSTQVDITSEIYDQFYPSIAVDSSSNINVVWYGKSAASPSYSQIRYAKYSGGSWLGTPNITSGSYAQGCPNISKDGSVFVWRGTTDGSGVSSADWNAGLMFGVISSMSLTLSPIAAIESPKTPTITKVSNNGDGRDISVTFTGNDDETNIQEYRIIAVPNGSTLNTATAVGIAASRYIVEPKNGNGGSHSVTLTQSLLDSTGILISSGMQYRIYILAIGQNGQPNVLSSVSNWLYLTSPLSGIGINKIIPSGVSLASNNARAIVKDGLGNYYVAFTISNYVYVRKSEDGGNTWKYWNGTAFGTTGSECYLNYYSNASIAVDSSNNLYLVYSKGSGGIYYMKYIPGGSWTSEANLSGNYYSHNPSIVIDSSDIIHVIWSGPSELSPSYNQIRYTKYSGGTWSSPIDLTSESYSQNNASIAIDNSGNIHAVWYGCSTASPTYNQIRYAKYSEGAWSNSVDLTSGNYLQYNPSIAIDSSNNLHVVWHGKSVASTSKYQIRYAKYSGGSWLSPVDITSGNYDQNNPSIAVDSSNNLHMVWYGRSAASPSYYQIRYSEYTTSWSSPVDKTFGDFDQQYPNISKDGSAFVWKGTTDGSGVSSASYSTGLMFYIAVIPTPASGTPSASDVANNGDGRDIQVTFTGAADETNISGYRIFVVKSTDASSFGCATASGLASSRYVAVGATTAGATHTLTLTQTLEDSSGAAIQNGVAYKIFVLSKGNTGYSDTLSSNSTDLTLALTIQEIITMSDAVKDLANNGDGSDIRVMFKSSLNEKNIQGYRLIVARKAIAGDFNLSTASALSQVSYVAEPVKGKGRIHLFRLTQSLQDSEGNLITGSVAYSVYVLAVGKTGYSNTLTILGDITLDTNNAGKKVTVSTPTVADSASNGNGTDLKVSFRKPKSEANIESYRIIVSTTDLTLTTAQDVLASGYTSFTPTATGIRYIKLMGSEQKDNDGTEIQEGTAYKVYVLAIGKNGYANVLSSPSKLITLSQYVPGTNAVRSVRAVKVGSGHDSSNIGVSFYESVSVSNVQEYRVFISPSGSTLDQTTADGISNATLYQVVATTGRGKLHTVTLETGKKDYSDEALAAGSYKVYVLAVGKTGFAGKLSVAIRNVTLD